LASAARTRARIKGTGVYVDQLQAAGAFGEVPAGRSAHPTYEAASHGRRTHHWRPPEIGPNAALEFNLTELRNRSRDQVRQNAFASRASDAWVSNLVGTGIKPLPKAENNAYRQRLQALWNAFAVEADAGGELDFYGLEAQIARSWFEGGECFVRRRARRTEDGLTIPLQLQVLEAEHLPIEMNQIADSGNLIRHGIEFDAIGRRVAYHFYRTHPGDRRGFEFLKQGNPDVGLTTRVPAGEVLHIYLPRRPGQKRGEPALTQALITLRDLDQFLDAELLRQKMGAMFLGFVTQPSLDQEGPSLGDQDPDAEAAEALNNNDSGADEIQTAQPGSIAYLAEGESVEWSKPPEVGDTFEAFVRHRLRAVAQSAAVLYEQLTGDYSQINDRTYRASHNDLRRQIETLQNTILVPQLCRPVWRWFFEVARTSGALSVPRDVGRDEADRVEWVAPGFRYIHPVQDVQADRARVRSGYKSRSQVVIEQGGDPLDVEREIAAENERADEQGLVFDTDPRKVSQSGGAHGGNAGFGADQDSVPSDGDQQEPRSRADLSWAMVD